MRIRCLHGYFIFEEVKVGEIADFMGYYGLVNIVPKDNYFTFEKLLEAPEYSLKGKSFLGFTATETYEGKPWEIFEVNNAVYDFTTDLIKPIGSIKQRAIVNEAGKFYTSPGLLLPGALTDAGLRVKDYSAWFNNERLSFLYSEISYV